MYLLNFSCVGQFNCIFTVYYCVDQFYWNGNLFLSRLWCWVCIDLFTAWATHCMMIILYLNIHVDVGSPLVPSCYVKHFPAFAYWIFSILSLWLMIFYLAIWKFWQSFTDTFSAHKIDVYSSPPLEAIHCICQYGANCCVFTEIFLHLIIDSGLTTIIPYYQPIWIIMWSSLLNMKYIQ